MKNKVAGHDGPSDAADEQTETPMVTPLPKRRRREGGNKKTTEDTSTFKAESIGARGPRPRAPVVACFLCDRNNKEFSG